MFSNEVQEVQPPKCCQRLLLAGRGCEAFPEQKKPPSPDLSQVSQKHVFHFVMFPVEFSISKDTKVWEQKQEVRSFSVCTSMLRPSSLKATQGRSFDHLQLLQLEGTCVRFPGYQALGFALPKMLLLPSLIVFNLQCHLCKAVRFASIGSCPYPSQSLYTISKSLVP